MFRSYPYATATGPDARRKCKEKKRDGPRRPAIFTPPLSAAGEGGTAGRRGGRRGAGGQAAEKGGPGGALRALFP